MGSNAALAQLLDMGIPGGRASAALKRSKGDVMAAAERVFAGEFDDIPSDNEGDNDEPNGGPSKPRVMDEENDELDGDSDMFDDEDDGIPEDRLLSDPYAGIFFSKDRTETVIEMVDDPIHVSLRIPKTSSAGARTEDVRLLSMGEWMSGCPEGNEQSFLFQLWNFLAEGTMACSHGCGHSFRRKQQDFFPLIPEFPAYIAYLASIVRPTCPKCSRVTCLACGERVDTTGTDLDHLPGGRRGFKTPAPELEVDSLLHCVNLQGVIIGVGLFIIEQAFAQGRKAVPKVSKSPPKKKARTGRLLSPNEDEDDDSDDGGGWGLGSGRGTKAAKGTGYAGVAAEDRSGQKAAEQAQLVADTETATLLSQVQIYLPTANRGSGTRTSDHLVHPTALAHLRRRSGFVNDLLRNDSLLDMSNRGALYRALFDWLEIVSSHESLSSMLAMPQMRPVAVHPVPGEPHQRCVIYEGSSSPRELLESIVIQAKAALRGLEATKKPEDPEEVMDEEAKRISTSEAERLARAAEERRKKDPNAVLRNFCDRIISSAINVDKSLVETKGKPFVERMRESLPRLPEGDLQAKKVETGVSDEAIIKIYEEWAGKARFQYADLLDPTAAKGADAGKGTSSKAYRHAYSSQVIGLEGHDAPKRSLAIAKELAILTTNLPVAWHSSIFLRVDETRVDCIKALIIGPEATPYENGVFLFDIFLPLEYNVGCPLVKSMTTNGGKFRYNPNLYADGKVCLSLLGTWQGPGWISGQSTLLQVLISIQSLILCEEPYCNEPGWASGSGTAASKAYSANVRRMVVIDAMANNIKEPPFPFENEIKTHFRLKARYIRAQLDRWEKLDDGRSADGHNMGSMGSSPTSAATGEVVGDTPFKKSANELRKLLDGLDAPATAPVGKVKKGKSGRK